MKNKKFLLAIAASFIILLVILLLTFNSSHKVNNELKIGYIPIADAGVLYIAVDKGFFIEEGINVSLTQLGGGSLILNALGSDNIDIGFSNVLSFLLALNAKLELISVGGVAFNDQNSIEGAILTLDSSSIKNIKGLKGKTIAINARANIVELSLKKLLFKNGISIKDVKLVEIPFPQMESVLRSNQVDAIVVAEPFWTFAESRGGVKTIGYYFGDVYEKIEITSFFAKKEWTMKNELLADKIKNVFRKATDYINNPQNIDEVRRIYSKYTRVDSITAQKMRLPKFQYEISSGWINALVTDLKDEKLISQDFTLSQINF